MQLTTKTNPLFNGAVNTRLLLDGEEIANVRDHHMADVLENIYKGIPEVFYTEGKYFSLFMRDRELVKHALRGVRDEQCRWVGVAVDLRA